MNSQNAAAPRVTTAEFVRNIAFWQERALDHPLVITYHGRERLVLGPAAILEASPLTPGGAGLGRELELLIEKMHDGFVVFDENLTFVAANRQSEAFSGLSVDQLLGRTFDALFGQSPVKAFASVLRRVLASGEEELHQGPSGLGQVREIAIRAFPHPKGVGVLVRNRSREAELERQAASEDGMTSALMANKDIGAVRLDGFGHITEVAAGFTEITGFEPDVLRDRPFVDLLDRASRRVFTEAFEDVMKTRGVRTLKALIVARDTQLVPLNLSMAAKVSGLAALGACVVATRAAPFAGAPAEPTDSANCKETQSR